MFKIIKVIEGNIQVIQKDDSVCTTIIPEPCIAVHDQRREDVKVSMITARALAARPTAILRQFSVANLWNLSHMVGHFEKYF